MSLWQGVKGAQVELAAIPHPWQKLRRLASISKIFAAEILGTIALAPYAYKASSLYNTLPSFDSYEATDKQPVYIAKDVGYASAPRNTVDLYLPLEAAAAVQQGRERDAQNHPKVPVVVFVHGGVWAAGDKWHYAPLAACLARLGVLSCVVSYTLYPDALVPQMVDEVAAAFDWAVENVERYGGDCQQISLVGHSAGAQLCMMALLQRAKSMHEALQQSKHHQNKVIDIYTTDGQQQQQQQQVMPRQFVAITGVYDIARHYSYEQDRGVHELSTMKRAMGGFQGFAAMSPAVVLGAALQQQQQDRAVHNLPLQQTQQQQQQQQQQLPPACDFYSSFQLSGEAIAHRIGFDRDSSHYQAVESGLQQQNQVGMNDVMDFPLSAAAHLPPTVLISSCTDMTVPWYESAEMYHKLLDAGVAVKHLVYNKVGHGDFVVDWPSHVRPSSDINSSSAHDDDNNDDDHHDVHDWGHTFDKCAQQPGASAASCVGDESDWAGNGGAMSTGFGDKKSEKSNNTGRFEVSLLQRYGRQQLLEELPHYCRDLAVVVTNQQPVKFVKKQVSYENMRSTSAVVSTSGGVGAAEKSSAGLQSVVLKPGGTAADDVGAELDGAGRMANDAAADGQMMVQLADCDLN